MNDFKLYFESIERSIRENKSIAIQTSGTTGERKTVLKDVAFELEKKVKRDYHPSSQIGFFYSLGTWASLSVILHAIKNNVRVKHLSFENLDEVEKCTDICMTPSQAQKLLRSGRSFNDVNQVTLGGEYATQYSLDCCKKLFSSARITHVYASTETGDICSSSDGIEGYPREKFKNFSFLEDGSIVANGIVLKDSWKIDGDRYKFTGRVDAKLNIAGALVSLEEVEAKILEINGIEDCVCISIKAPVIGNAIKLEYVGSIDKSSLSEIILNTFSKHQRPILIEKVTQIKLSDSGKKKRL